MKKCGWIGVLCALCCSCGDKNSDEQPSFQEPQQSQPESESERQIGKQSLTAQQLQEQIALTEKKIEHTKAGLEKSGSCEPKEGFVKDWQKLCNHNVGANCSTQTATNSSGNTVALCTAGTQPATAGMKCEPNLKVWDIGGAGAISYGAVKALCRTVGQTPVFNKVECNSVGVLTSDLKKIYKLCAEDGNPNFCRISAEFGNEGLFEGVARENPNFKNHIDAHCAAFINPADTLEVAHNKCERLSLIDRDGNFPSVRLSNLLGTSICVFTPGAATDTCTPNYAKMGWWQGLDESDCDNALLAEYKKEIPQEAKELIEANEKENAGENE